LALARLDALYPLTRDSEDYLIGTVEAASLQFFNHIMATQAGVALRYVEGYECSVA